MSLREVLYFSAASALGLFTFVFFIFSGNARLKQRLWVVVHVLGGGLFIGFMLGRGLTALGTFFTVFFALGFVYLSLTNSRFCAECASLIFGPERPEWRGKCPSCGAPLPWSYYAGKGDPASARDNGAGGTGEPGNAPNSGPVEPSAREEAEIARTFETEGEHHAAALPPKSDAEAQTGGESETPDPEAEPDARETP